MIVIVSGCRVTVALAVFKVPFTVIDSVTVAGTVPTGMTAGGVYSPVGDNVPAPAKDQETGVPAGTGIAVNCKGGDAALSAATVGLIVTEMGCSVIVATAVWLGSALLVAVTVAVCVVVMLPGAV
jgi:hypothetical protein